MPVCRVRGICGRSQTRTRPPLQIAPEIPTPKRRKFHDMRQKFRKSLISLVQNFQDLRSRLSRNGVKLSRNTYTHKMCAITHISQEKLFSTQQLTMPCSTISCKGLPPYAASSTIYLRITCNRCPQPGCRRSRSGAKARACHNSRHETSPCEPAAVGAWSGKNADQAIEPVGRRFCQNGGVRSPRRRAVLRHSNWRWLTCECRESRTHFRVVVKNVSCEAARYCDRG